MPSVTIAGTAFSQTPATASGAAWAPSKVELEVRKVGSLLEAANGSLTYNHRAHKHRFTLSWDKCSAQTRAALLTQYKTTASFAYTHTDGNAYTVICPPDGFKDGTALASLGGLLYYDVTLQLWEV